MWPQRFVTDLLLWIRLPFRCFKEIAIESTVDLAFPVREEPCREPCTSCLSPLQSQEVGTGIPSAKVRSGGTKSLSHFLKKCPRDVNLPGLSAMTLCCYLSKSHLCPAARRSSQQFEKAALYESPRRGAWPALS